MSRPLRIEYEGAWYHVMNRGRRSERIYQEPRDYQTFIELLKETIELWDIRISAYCLMPTHYHLLINTPRGNLSRAMRHLSGIYTQRFNRAHGMDGPLFRGRYKSIIVDGDSYLLQLVRYIHRNPLRAGLVERLEDYPLSSHKGYLSSSQNWHWIYKDFILGILSNKGRSSQLRAYKKFMEGEDRQEITQAFEEGGKWPVFLGDEDFWKWLRERFYKTKRNPEVPGSLSLAPKMEEIRKVVCSYFGIEEAELLKSRRGKDNEPRDLTIYLIRRLRQESLSRLAEEFGLKGYSSVSSIIVKMEKRLEKDNQLRCRLEEIRHTILKGQT